MAKKIDELVIEIRGDLKDLKKGLAESAKVTTKSVDKIKKSLLGAQGAFTVFAGTLAAKGVTSALAVLNNLFSQTTADALEFSKSIAEINSILPKNEKITLAAKNEFIKFSNSFAGKPQAQAKAFYAIVSAGVKGTAKQLSVLKTANKAAVAGLVDIDISARVLVSSVNAYAESGLTAEQASDALFVTVREGQTTFTELANSMGTVAPIAAAAGISFSDLTGALAFVTKSGVSTSEAATGLRATITSLIKPTEDAKKAAAELGIELSTKGVKAAGGLANFFDKLKTATGGSEVALGKLFPNVRALSTVISITRGDFEDFKNILSETEKATGATDIAFQVMSKSAAFQFERLTQELQNIPQAFLVNFEDPIADAIKSIRDFAGGKGILLVADAVTFTIDALVAFNEAINSVSGGLDFVIDSFLATKQALLEFKLIQTEATKAEIAEIKLIRAEIQKSTFFRNKATDEAIADIEKFKKKLEESRAKQIVIEEKFREKQKEADLVAATGKISSEQTLSLAQVSELQTRNDLLRNLDSNAHAEEIAENEKRIKIRLQQETKFTNEKITLLLKERDTQKAVEINKAANLKRGLSALSNTFGQTKNLLKKGSAEYKIAAIAQATISTFLAATESFAAVALIPFVGPALAPIAAAAAIAAGLVNIATITAVQLKHGTDSVPGIGNKDNVPALLQPKERVLSRPTNKDLTSFLSQVLDSNNKLKSSFASQSNSKLEISLKDDLIDFIEMKFVERGLFSTSIQAG